MARERSPNRDKAFKLWKQSGGTMKLKDIAAQLGISDIQVRKWKNQDHWEKVTLPYTNSNVTNDKGNVTNEPKTVTKEPFPGQCEANSHKTGQRCQKKAKPGERFCAQHLDGWPGQCTAKSKQTGERCRKPAEPRKKVCKFHGGRMIPEPGEQRALKHGFFAKIFPDDEETRALVSDIMEKSPLDIIWEQIIIQYTAIARAQKVMFVTHKREMIKELKKIKSELGERNQAFNPDNQDSKPVAETYREEEWEFQFAWDRQATFLKAQSEAMKALERLIQRYEDLVEKYELKGLVVEEHRLRVDKLKAEVEKLQGSGPGDGDAWADLVAGDDEDGTEES